MMLAILFCCTPTFAEESIHERTELTEEAVLLVTTKRQKVGEQEVYLQRNFIPSLTEVVEKTSTYFPAIKRYILFSSLRFCD